MRRVRGLVVALALVLVASVASAPEAPPSLDGAIYLDLAYSPAERAADLVSRMTLEEKAGQLVSSQSPAIKRLGVRAYGWWSEAIHGVSREGVLDGENPPDLLNTTSYPVSLSLAASWDPALVYRVATAISDEAREVVRDNTLDLNFYSPTVNLSRDPRWGRNDETYGEDPLLTAALAAQYVNGMQGNDEQGTPLGKYLKTATTLKHFAANNSEVNRLTGSADMDERTLREYYTAQFRDVVRASHPASIMTAYNEVNGVPASASTHLMQVLGRQTFGFTGFYTSDCDSVFEIENGHAWTPPGADGPLDAEGRSAWANAAGVDLNCQLGYHDRDSFATTLPDAVRDRLPTELGPFAEAYLDDSLVRLFTVRFALGEFDDPARVPWVSAARARVPAGSWVSTDANRAVTQTSARLALARDAAAQSVVLLRNAGVRPVLPLAVPASGAYRVAVVGRAARPDELFLGGYSSVQASAGRANSVSDYDGLVAAVHRVNSAAAVDYFPSATTALSGYDVVIVVAATDNADASEDHDRRDLALPDDQAALIRAAAARNPRTVAVLHTVGPVEVGGLVDRVPALVWSSYNGQRGGEALADVLLGAVDPGGRLPFTWYRDATQLPPITDYGIRPAAKSPGRTYQYFTGTPTFPFGYGLSYTTFGYGSPRASRTGDQVTVSVDVTNTGRVAGSEVVQLYVTSPGAQSPDRTARRLAGFRKVTLRPGETTRVSLPVAVSDLAFFDEKADRFVVDPGTYTFAVGSSSDDIRGQARVSIAADPAPALATVSVAPRAATNPPGGRGRVAFRIGDVVEPQLTIALSDDTRYGYLTPEATRPLPSGATVTYASNRPTVATVDDGVIRAAAPGVATITATVTYRAAATATTFVLTVHP